MAKAVLPNPYGRPARVHVVEGLGANGSATVVFAYGEHDYATRHVLSDALAPIATHAIVDLSWCAFVDTSVIGVILAKRRTLAGAGHTLELVVPTRHIGLSRTIDLLGIRAIVDVHQPLPPFP